ncbi:3'-5' exonuclease [Kordiimonas sp.]|uniref:3'-5' exonuclease n=1 Tax=Kordiimonas sp. TaxID=1970157 RepID=UPI003A8F108C
MSNPPIAIVIDTETNRREDPEPIEVSWFSVELLECELCADQLPVTYRFRPDGKFECGAVAVHGIFPQDVANCPPSSEAIDHLPPLCEYFIGHNVDFDWRVMGSPDVRRICTLALARKYMPGLDTYQLGALVYEIMGYDDFSRELVSGAHGAAADVAMARIIASYVTSENNIETIEELWQASEAARIPDVMPFGKHKGEPIAMVPQSYKDWLLGQSDVDEYLRKALLR